VVVKEDRQEKINDKGESVFADVQTECDLLEIYFQLPPKREVFDSLIYRLEQGIGMYRAREREARREVLNPTASLYSALCLTPFSVRQIGTVIAPLHPGHKLEDRLNRIRAQG